MGRHYSERKCEAEGCDEKHFGRGLCRKHYNARAYNGMSDQQKAEMRARKKSVPWLSVPEREEIKLQTLTYLRLKWEQIGQYAAARRFVA